MTLRRRNILLGLELSALIALILVLAVAWPNAGQASTVDAKQTAYAGTENSPLLLPAMNAEPAPPWDGPTVEPTLHLQNPFSADPPAMEAPVDERLAVPEPGVLALFAGGACISLLFRSRRVPA